MRVETDPKPRENFQPFELRLTFETAKEADVFYALFCHSDLCNWLRSYDMEIVERIRGVIEDRHERLNYSGYFDALAKIVKGN